MTVTVAGPSGVDHGNLLRLTLGHAVDPRLELVGKTARPELDDEIPVLRCLPAPLPDKVEHQRVSHLGRATGDRDELGHIVSEPLELGVDEFGRHLRLRRRYLERRPVGDLGLGCDRDRGREPERLALSRQSLPLDLGPIDRANAGLHGRIPEPAVDVRTDSLGGKRIPPHPCGDDRKRHLPLPKAGDPEICGEVRRRVLEGVLDSGLGHLDLEPDLAVLELLDFRLHRTPHSIRWGLAGRTVAQSTLARRSM